MKRHVKIYFSHFGYGEQSFVPCEICGKRANDIHHLTYKSQGGKDEIGNLMALCRLHHDRAHSGEINKAVFQARHEIFLNDKA